VELREAQSTFLRELEEDKQLAWITCSSLAVATQVQSAVYEPES
jgi:hypothetical protein